MLPGYKQPGALTGTLPTQDSLRPLLQASEGDPPTAPLTKSIAAFVHLAQGFLQLMDSLIPAPDCILPNLFHLHGIKAREPADRHIHGNRLGIYFLRIRFLPKLLKLIPRPDLELDLFLDAKHEPSMSLHPPAGKIGHRNRSPARFPVATLRP